MKGKQFTIFLGIITVIVIFMALAAESIYFSDFEYRYRTRLFNNSLKSREKIMEDCLEAMRPILANEEHHGSVPENNLFSIAGENDLTILEYFDNKLNYWSDNEFDAPLFYDKSLYEKPFIFIQNGWFLTKTIQARNEILVGLLRVHTDYSFENDFIKSGFIKDFRMPVNVDLSLEKDDSEYHISNSAGDFLFSLVFPEVKENTNFILIPLICWAAVFILIILLSKGFVKLIVNAGRNRLAVGLVLAIFLMIYFILLAGKPVVLVKTNLFLPYKFSLNNLIPSLGHLAIFSILSACFSFMFLRYFVLPEQQKGKAGKDYLFLTIFLIFVAFLFSACNQIFKLLISNSGINFEPYKVLELSALTFVGFAGIFLLYLAPVFFLLKIFQTIKHFRQKTIILSLITSLIIPLALFWNDPAVLIPFVLFYFVVAGTLWVFALNRFGIFNMTVVVSFIFGIYSLCLITIQSQKKITENLKIQAVSLSTENDPEAEHLLLDLWPEISNDSSLTAMMSAEYFDFDSISNYLEETYFKGYWRNYNYGIVLCHSNESLRIGNDNEVFENCFSFFEERISRDGHTLTGTGFYSIDNQGGRAYYIGRLFYKMKDDITNGLFIELYSNINMLQPGYSELLLDKSYHIYAGLKDYSFAKYINGEIVLTTGDFPYDKTDIDYLVEDSEYNTFTTDGFKHILYKNGNTTILISRPRLSVKDHIISFAYLFAFAFIFINLLLLIIKRPDLSNLNNFNFRQKLQMSFIGVLLFSFVLIGVVVASFTIRQYQTKHNDNLKEKLNSIYLELDGKISMEEHLSADWTSSSYATLNDLLIKFSNIFMTDINIYDLNGFLIATSRPEIYYRDLKSSRIDNMASINLVVFKESEYYHRENIGSLEYISGYVPFYNTKGEVLAYLNLPYFRMQSILAKEISNLIIAVINFTLLLVVITMSLAVFISGRLTSPLLMLTDGLASVEVGKKSEHLTYRGNDEISELVKQYNHMVDEIEESAYKLANSEREYAWREMAKQIAHEIKNPLTPMKLNVQQLLKSWNDKVPGFEKKLERFTENQIEFIDNLSSIASAFSAFAKMPGTNPVEVNLLDQIKITLELFRDTDNVTFNVQWPQEKKVIVFADKEHLNGVFSNLLKNGIQSIPSGRVGVIKIGMEVRRDKVLVSISDNGTGVPEELQKKLFIPNFTTKSSGMGLGLSIVKRYVENANGKIWFESEADNGSVFYVELPLLYTVERLG